MSSACAKNVQPSGSQLRPEEHECSDRLKNYENYDVFVSHRGPDTKKGVVRDLQEAFKRAGLRAFLDCDSIELAQHSWCCIEHAIQKTPIAVVIFSKNFARSKWCMKELHLILNNPNIKLIPIIYGVKPYDVERPEEGELKEGFEKLKAEHENSDIELWKEDLVVASQVMGFEYSGEAIRSRYELVTEIVATVSDLGIESVPLHVGNHVFGIVQQAKEMVQFLEANKNVVMVGVWGPGGIGKSTLAKELYNQLQHKYASAYFAEGVREKIGLHGIPEVQTAILHNLCNDAIVLKDKSKGKSVLQKRLVNKQVLLVLDDVADSDMLEDLIGHDTLGEGSLCIVTSRCKGVLSWDNSSNYMHETGFKALKIKIVKACGGIPLVLVVIGKHLKELGATNLKFWKDVLDQLKHDPGIMEFEGVFKSLVISYKPLQTVHQEMFLDIACAFLGRDVDRAKRVWRAQHKRSVEAGVRILENKALITVDKRGFFAMHDHLRDMGRAIVQKQLKKDGVYRRMWMPDSMDYWMKNKSFPERLQTLVLCGKNDLSDLGDDINDFSHMTKLRILICRDVITNNLAIPKSLLMFSWTLLWITLDAIGRKPCLVGGAKSSFIQPPPMNSKLVVLDIRYRQINVNIYDKVSPGDGVQVSPRDESWGINETQFSVGAEVLRCEKLEVLDLSSDFIPMTLPKELGSLENLSLLPINFVKGLPILAKSLGQSKSLKCLLIRRRLLISGCFGINASTISNIACLERLGLYRCGLQSEEAHTLFSNLGNLTKLPITGSSIQTLPVSLGNLTNLTELAITGSSIQTLPESLGNLTNLSKLDLGSNYWLTKLPESFGELTNLRWLSLARCDNLELPPDSFAQLSSLRELHVGECYSDLPWGTYECGSSCEIAKLGMGAILFKRIRSRKMLQSFIPKRFLEQLATGSSWLRV